MKKIILTLFLASVALVSGVTVAYYNTSSLGYDNANVIYIDDEKVIIFDFTFNYKEFEENVEKAKELLPDEFRTI